MVSILAITLHTFGKTLKRCALILFGFGTGELGVESYDAKANWSALESQWATTDNIDIGPESSV